MISIYRLKPGFQALLLPLVKKFAHAGITDNSVTLFTVCISVVLGASLTALHQYRQLFLLVPIWMFLRMALNAIDGMLAREFGQKSALGAYLNELTDVVSDAALYLPFIAIAPFNWWSVGAVIFLSTVSEMAGTIGPMIGAERRYDGPMGKSDRAFLFGALGLWVFLSNHLPEWIFWIMPITTAAIMLNIINRVRRGIITVRPSIY